MKTLIGILLLGSLCACGLEKDQQEANAMEDTVDYAFTCDLVNDEARIAEYRHFHSEEGVWPEVLETFEASGACSVKIFIQERRLVLLITLPESLTFEEFSERYATTSDRIDEWDSKMASFQLPPPGGEEGGTWVSMEKIFNYEKRK